MASPLTEYDPELETFEGEQLEWSGEGGAGVLTETDEMELAAQLLEVRDEQELDQFLGGLIRKVGRAVRRVVRSPIGRAIGGALKGVVARPYCRSPAARSAPSSAGRSELRSVAISRRWPAARSAWRSKA